MKNLFVLLLLCPLLLVWGQEKNQSTQKEKQVAEAQAAVDATQSQLEAQILPGEAFYNAQGRRDPFVNLLLGRNVRENRQAIEGLPGLLIDEWSLKGLSV